MTGPSERNFVSWNQGYDEALNHLESELKSERFATERELRSRSEITVNLWDVLDVIAELRSEP